MLCNYSSKAFSTNADFHALLDAAEHIKYKQHHRSAGDQVQEERRAMVSDVPLIIHGEKVPSRNIGGVGFVTTHQSLVLSIRMRTHHRLAIPRLRPPRLKTTIIVNCNSSTYQPIIRARCFPRRCGRDLHLLWATSSDNLDATKKGTCD
ncbi:unnamed protein product [Cylicostephanus goldi]|uniref:Uncharacterized protein n=1 Tax=Cylicostephanus goldi TaxID=71465 RepID=A0A3P6RZH0_CYLGO|nr:unnamed protein product [Cylicostephanus goldi]